MKTKPAVLLSTQKGFNLTELLVVAGLAAGLALGFTTMLQNQAKAVKGLFVKVEIQNIHNTVSEIMRVESNCVATMLEASPTPPTLQEPVQMQAIYVRRQVNGEFVNIPFYQLNRIYDNSIRIKSITLRPFSASLDQTPGPKLELSYEITAKIVGANSFTKKFEFFSTTQPIPEFPNYNFRCNAGGGGTSQFIVNNIAESSVDTCDPEHAGAIRFNSVEKRLEFCDGTNFAPYETTTNPNSCKIENTGVVRYNATESRLEFCNGSAFTPYSGGKGEIEPVQNTVSLGKVKSKDGVMRQGTLGCPEGKRAVSCGFNDTVENGSEDSFACYVNLSSNQCVYAIDPDDDHADAVTFQCICL